jgi:hypothetical protein
VLYSFSAYFISTSESMDTISITIIEINHGTIFIEKENTTIPNIGRNTIE